MNKPKLSLIIEVDHDDKYYGNLVKQAQSQDYQNLEIIIVSNRLNTKEQFLLDFLVCQDNHERTKHLSFIKRACRSSLYNEAIKYASGDYIWCLDQSILLNDENAITRIMSNLIESKAQAIYLLDETEATKETQKSNNSREIIDDKVLEHPSSIINQNDWKNQSRLIINLGTIRLFNLRFIEGWSYIHGALWALQVIRFFPNIYYLPQNSASYKNKINHYKYTQKSLIELKLSLNYILRFSELIYGVRSTVFQIILKKEIEDCGDFSKSVDSSILNKTTKDFLKYSRKLCIDYYIKKAFEPTDETTYLQSKIEKLTDQSDSKHCEMLNQFFKHCRVKVHCGAHKTATTYIQSTLNEARHDLALQNTFYIHYEQLRDDYIKAKQVENIHESNERFAFAILQQAALLAFKLPSMLIISEENLITPSENIYDYWDSEATHESAANYSSACIRNGYNLTNLKDVAQIFDGEVEIIYTIRNYYDYLLSRHSEFLKWRKFKEFDGEFLSQNDLKRCEWGYLVSDLKKLSHSTSIISFESYKYNPVRFANYLAEYDLHNYEPKNNDNQAISRSRAGQKLLDKLINKKRLGYDSSSLKNIFAVNIEHKNHLSGKFESKLFGQDLLNQSEAQYNSNWLSKATKVGGKNYQKLTSQQTCENQSLKELPLPERYQLPIKHNSGKLYHALNLLNKNLLFTGSRFKDQSVKDGLSAMIRIKNEARNIYNVLNSIKEHFDEIVIVDNDSSDDTINEINRAIIDFPLLKTKLKLHHYKYKIARCGIDNFKEPQNSPYSLASFYNYSLSKCRFSRICKWDGDMLLPKSMNKSFKDFLAKVKAKSPSSDASTVFGVMKGLTVYKGSNGKFYCRHGVFDKEARIFDNTAGVFFVKEILWEQLYSLHNIERIISDDITFVEFKDTNINEFAHWSVESSLGMSPRKSKELRDFNLIKRISQNKDLEETNRLLASLGFSEINFNLFDFA